MEETWQELRRLGVQERMGGRAGLEIQPYEHGRIEYFLSTGNEKIPHSEYYKKTPELAKAFTETIPEVKAPACLVFKPLKLVNEGETPECIIFLVNAEQCAGQLCFRLRANGAISSISRRKARCCGYCRLLKEFIS